MNKKIPISVAKKIAEDYGYDQIIILAKITDVDGVQHVTTYGKTKLECIVAGAMGDYLKSKVLKWCNEEYVDEE